MKRRLRALFLALALMAGVTAAVPTAAQAVDGIGGVNDPACRSAAHPDPVVMLHGLGGSAIFDISLTQAYLAAHGYCTFSLTYGAYAPFPIAGGLKPMAESGVEIKNFILQVLAETGASKADLVGHSEGAFQALLVTKTQGIASRIGRIAAIAAPIGSTVGGLFTIAEQTGQSANISAAIQAFGCYPCIEQGPGGSSVQALHNGPVTQPGVSYTTIVSRYDELVTPPSVAFVNEPGVVNEYVQDFCPFDPVGHINETNDPNVWHMVDNALDPAHAKPFVCAVGLPG